MHYIECKSGHRARGFNNPKAPEPGQSRLYLRLFSTSFLQIILPIIAVDFRIGCGLGRHRHITMGH